MITASEALERLRDGNRRFVAGHIGAGIRDSLARRQVPAKARGRVPDFAHPPSPRIRAKRFLASSEKVQVKIFADAR